MSVSKGVAESIACYFTSNQPKIPSARTLDAECVQRFLEGDIHRHKEIGKHMELFHGVLSVEMYIRLIEKLMQVVLPDVAVQLGWNYPDTDVALEAFLRGDSEAEAKQAFDDKWQKYLDGTLH